jgi:hypothetical protein
MIGGQSKVWCSVSVISLPGFSHRKDAKTQNYFGFAFLRLCG